MSHGRRIVNSAGSLLVVMWIIEHGELELQADILILEWKWYKTNFTTTDLSVDRLQGRSCGTIILSSIDPARAI